MHYEFVILLLFLLLSPSLFLHERKTNYNKNSHCFGHDNVLVQCNFITRIKHRICVFLDSTLVKSVSKNTIVLFISPYLSDVISYFSCDYCHPWLCVNKIWIWKKIFQLPALQFLKTKSTMVELIKGSLPLTKLRTEITTNPPQYTYKAQLSMTPDLIACV